MNDASPSGLAWWRWPTILSLDAPTVTVAWQWLLARVALVPLAWYHYVIVWLATWLAYSADRWLEGGRLTATHLHTARHRFYREHRGLVAGLWLAALAAALWLAGTRLARREFIAGLLLLVPVLIYLLSHQLIHRGHPWRLPKEVCVSILVAAGAAVFLLVAPGVRWVALEEGLGWFTALAFVNCALIGRWEQAVDREQGQDSLVLWYPWSRRVIPWLPWGLLVIAAAGGLAAPGDRRALRVCALASAALLGGIDRIEKRAGWPLARMLADAALLTPVVWRAILWLSS